jgi:molecular chaperone GrpE
MNDEELKDETGVEPEQSEGTEEQGAATPVPPPNDLETKNAEYLSGWKRALADYENLKKMSAQNREDDKRRVRMNMAEDLLPVVDNFGYVTKHVPSLEGVSDEFKKKFDTWFTGIQHIDRQFTEALKGLGVEAIESVGKQFDPKLHEAGGSKKDESKPDGEVLEELIKGWKIGDMAIRPAKVIVNEL